MAKNGIIKTEIQEPVFSRPSTKILNMRARDLFVLLFRYCVPGVALANLWACPISGSLVGPDMLAKVAYIFLRVH